MGKALIFLIQIVIFVVASVWIVQRPGSVVINWGDYTLTVQLGYLLLLSLAFVITAMVFYRTALAIMAIPEKAVQFRRQRLHEKGYRALLQGFSAVAAGNGKEAVHLASKARGSLSGDDGLVLLLEAQAFRLAGDSKSCEASLKELMEHRDLAYLGVRGMIKLSVENGRMDKALAFAQQALAAHPKQPEMLRMAYQLQLRNQNWEQAGKTLTLALRKGAFTREQAESDRAALFVAGAEQKLEEGALDDAVKKLKQAQKRYPAFVPAAVRLACLLKEQGKNRQAAKVIEKTWKKNPHPELAEVWAKLAPEPKAKDKSTARRLRWAEKLIDLKPDSAESQIAAARAAIADRLWGEARAYLEEAAALQPCARVYRLRAELEEKATQDDKKAEYWREKASSASPDKVWTCKLTGRVYDSWSPVAEPHGSFNTIVWSYPQEAGIACLQDQMYFWSSDLLQLG